MRFTIICFGIVVVGLTSWLVFLREAPNKEASAARSPSSREVEAFAPARPTPVAPSHRAAAPRDVQPARAVPSSPVAAAPPVAPEEAPYHDLLVNDRPRVAESWKLENAVTLALRKEPNFAGTLESIECRFRICKLRLLFDSVDADRLTVSKVFLDGKTEDFPNGFGALAVPLRVQLPAGKLRTTVYLAREGELDIPVEHAMEGEY